MILTNTTNIRDVIAFPKNQNARDIMNQSPSGVDQIQLDELKIKVTKMKRNDYITWDEYFMGVAKLSAKRSKTRILK